MFKKKFLLLAGDYRYPEPYRGNWRGLFETRELAKEAVMQVDFKREYHYDWYEIVDLEEYLYQHMNESELNR